MSPSTDRPASISSQRSSASGRNRDRVNPIPWSKAASSTAVTSAVAHGLVSSPSTSSIILLDVDRRGSYSCSRSSPAMRARVWSETPGLPLMTLETVGTDTRASLAMSAIVTRPATSLALSTIPRGLPFRWLLLTSPPYDPTIG